MDDNWLEWALNESCESRIFALINMLGKFDRYQASQGILAAALIVVNAAKERGMMEIETHHFAADGKRSWWDFNAPHAWTPLCATLSLTSPRPLFLDHRSEPFTLATYSSAASGKYRLVSVNETSDLQRKIVVIPAALYEHARECSWLKKGGAAGFITDAFARFDPVTGHYFRGRIELAPDSELFAFSVLPDELLTLQQSAQSSGEVSVEITLDHNATMPVVSALIPGDEGEREIWITAHLCHSRAGANDNASGVSAALEIAFLLQKLRGTREAHFRYPVRIVWGPEFLGVAALQHKWRYSQGPIAVINLDMVGEDQARCESPMCVELPLACFESPLGMMMQTLVQSVFALTPHTPGTWVSLPFQGFSDHALFMNHSEVQKNCPAVQLCHINDRFNHSAADTPDKVSLSEMKRSVAVSLALLMQLHGMSPEQISPFQKSSKYEEGGIVRCWQGPLNLRGLIQRLDMPLKGMLEKMINHDKRYLALLHHCALSADGRKREAIITAASHAVGLTLSDDVKALFYDILFKSNYFQACSADRTMEES